MGQIDNLTKGDIPDILRRLRAQEMRTTLNNSAIGRGGMEVYDGGVLNISNGGLVVNGSAQVIGTLNADGTINMTGIFIATGEVQLNGPVTVAGPLTIAGATDITGDTTVTGELTTNGPLHVNGATDISGNLDVDGTLDINGVATLNNDLNITGGGKIVAGDTEIHPGGSIDFGPSLTITPDNGFGAPAIHSGASSIQLTPADPNYWAQFSGGAYFQGLVSAMALKLNSLPTTTEPANLYIDGSGNVKRSTAA